MSKLKTKKGISEYDKKMVFGVGLMFFYLFMIGTGIIGFVFAFFGAISTALISELIFQLWAIFSLYWAAHNMFRFYYSMKDLEKDLEKEYGRKK